MCQRLPTSQAVTKYTNNHCLKPEVDNLLHATRLFQCCDTYGRQAGTAIEGCETVNAATTTTTTTTTKPSKLFKDKTLQYL